MMEPNQPMTVSDSELDEIDPRPELDRIDLQRTRAAVMAELFQQPRRRTMVDRYEIRGTAGEGAMGRVYRAYDPVLERPVALKVLARRGWGVREEARRARLLREARVLAQLTHPNVVQLFDVGVADGEVYVALEYVGGGTFREWIARGPHSIPEVVERITAAGRGLAAAHARGMVHRDFKPANVLIAEDGTVKVADFGLAKLGEVLRSTSEIGPATIASSSERTRTGTVLGTPAYMAPEQGLGAEVDARCDIHALCMVLHEALVGRRPEAGEDGGRRVDESLPKALRRVLVRGMRADPRERFPDVNAMLEALERATTPRRRGSWLAVGGLVAVVAAAAAVSAPWSREPESCADGETALDRSWNDTSRARLRWSLEESGPDFARAVAPRVVDGLDDYAVRWRSAHARACGAGEHRDPRMVCLAERRRALEALVVALTEADAESAARADDAVAGLPAIAVCDELEGMHPSFSWPSEPVRVAAIEEAERQLSRVRAMRLAGRYDEALAAARDALVQAEVAGHPPLVPRARSVLADVHEELGDFPAAARGLAAAYDEAAANGQDDLALKIATRLVFVEGERMVRADEALRWARDARAWLRRAGREGGLAEADLHNNLGAVAHRQGRYDDAREAYQRSLELRQQHLPPGDRRIAMSLTNLGLVASMTGELDEALASHRRALALTEAELGPEHPRVAELRANLGGTYLARGEPERARQELVRVVEIQTRAEQDRTPRFAATLTNLALAEHDLGRFVDAVAHSERAWAIRRDVQGPEHPDTAIALLNLGVLDDEAGNHARAVKRYRRAVEVIAVAFGPEHAYVGVALHDLGVALRSDGRAEEGLARMKEALAIRERNADGPSMDVAYGLDDIGATLVMLGRAEEGLEWLERAEGVYGALLGPDDGEWVPLLCNLGDARRARGDLGRARAHYERALELGTAAWGADATDLGRSLRRLAELDLAEGRPEAARPRLERALALWAPRAPDPRAELRVLLAEASCAAGDRERGRALLDELASEEPSEVIDGARQRCGDGPP